MSNNNPPIKPQGSYITLNQGDAQGIKIHYTVTDSKQQSSYPVIFLQGSGPGASGWLNFRYNVDYFSEQGFQVIVPDLPGFGDSDKPDLDYTLDFFASAMLEFADQLDLEKFALVGNSLGGAVSLGMALAAPERVSHLILMGCGGLEDQMTYFQTMKGIQAMTAVPLGSPEFTPQYLKDVLKLIVVDPAHITDELIEERFRILATQNPAAFKRMIIPNITERLGQIKAPVLGFWGDKDNFCPVSGASTLAHHCQDAEVTILSNCGHWVMIEFKDLFNTRCVDFLKRK
ncbi:MAG: alpha/beta fold hydrolase [Pseudomonadales bacterium]|nr:alpha/beta fold hydrolase [Pseudomonadales bacterium]